MSEKGSKGMALRTGLWIAAGLVGVFLLGVLAVSLYLSPERLRGLLASSLETSLQRQVVLERVGFRLWGGVDASVEGLEVADRSGFGKRPFLAVDRAALSLSLWPFLKGEAIPGEVEIVQPELSVVIDEGGEANYADLLQGESTLWGDGMQLPVGRTALSEGFFRYEDRQHGAQASVEGIGYRLRLAPEGERFALTGELSVAKISSTTPGKGGMEMEAVQVTHRLLMAMGAERPPLVEGEGTLKIGGGKVVNWEWLKQAASNVSQLGFLNFEEIPIRAVETAFRVADGRIYFDELQMVAADMNCRLNGSAGMDGSLDYTLDVDLPASRLNVGGVNLGRFLGSFLGGDDKTIPLRIQIGGTTAHPVVRADLQPGGESRAPERRQEEKEKLKEQGKALLKRLF